MTCAINERASGFESSLQSVTTVLEAAPAGMILADLEGNILFANQHACRMFAYDAEELVQKKIERLLPAALRKQHVNLRTEYVKRPLTRTMGADKFLYAQDQKGRMFPVEVGLAAFTSPWGKAILATVVDISVRQERESERERLVEDLKRSTQELESFSYSVSHDLRAPLRTIDGYARILLEDYADDLDEEGKRVLGIVMKGAVTMSHLIDGILDFSRLGRQNVNNARVDMGMLARTVLEQQTKTVDERKIEYRIGKLAIVQGDQLMLEQVWVNLISNAIKFTQTREVSRIDIDGSIDGTTAVFSIRDNGVGFNMAYVDKVFQVFQRLHRVQDFEGTGVGLALVQRVIQRHGGSIRVESEEGAGTFFEFRIPLTSVQQILEKNSH